ncbi:MAG: M20/M25/M40 family metallo-hydrolase [Candidatus Dojkabacteria bacterium]|nr:MAG: M20/M25/M40 family metallo-hydrolase [Candidatus Dojkabacteria bacterium]
MQDPISLLEKLVNINSWSYNQEGINACNNLVVEAIKQVPAAHCEFLKKDGKPNLLIIRNTHVTGQMNVMFLGHMDTVHLQERHKDFIIKGEKAEGDGVEDMKGGNVVMLAAFAQLAQSNYNLTVVLNIDEEIGSTSYETELAKIYAEQQLTLVFEGGEMEDESRKLITDRKGIVAYDVKTVGKAGHSGVLTKPSDRLSSNLEMIYKLAEIQRLEEKFQTVSVNIGTIHGGQAFNIVSEETTANFEVRSFNEEEMHEALELVEEILKKIYRPGVTTEYKKLFNFMPLQKQADHLKVLEQLKSSLDAEGTQIEYGNRGGVSDANKVREHNKSALVIDALGPVGGESHTKNEWIELRSIQDSIDLTIKIVDNYNKIISQ